MKSLPSQQNAAMVRIAKTDGYCNIHHSTGEALVRRGLAIRLAHRGLSIKPRPSWALTDTGKRWIKA